MKFTAITIAFICKGMFIQDGDQCHKYIVNDNNFNTRILYVDYGEKWDIGDTLIVPDSIWSKAKDTLSY